MDAQKDVLPFESEEMNNWRWRKKEYHYHNPRESQVSERGEELKVARSLEVYIESRSKQDAGIGGEKEKLSHSFWKTYDSNLVQTEWGTNKKKTTVRNTEVWE